MSAKVHAINTATENRAGAPAPDLAGVTVLFEVAKDTVEDERSRGRNLDTKTNSLTAVAAALLALNATLGQPLLAADVGPVGSAVVEACFAVAVVALLIAAAVAVIGVLRPQDYLSLGRKDVRAFYEDAELQAAGGLEVRRRMLGTYADVLDTERLRNDRKAKLTKIAVVALAVGLLAVTGEALALFGREIGL